MPLLLICLFIIGLCLYVLFYKFENAARMTQRQHLIGLFGAFMIGLFCKSFWMAMLVAVVYALIYSCCIKWFNSRNDKGE
jgi:ABC-type spermidine/putrescine transport system permease subunit I